MLPQDDEHDSSEDDALSDHSEELHPETGFDPFLAATRRALQGSASSPIPTVSSTSSATTLTETGQATDPRTLEAQRWSSITKYWSKVVDQVFSLPNQGRIDLSQRQITDISPNIADLSYFVALPPPRYDKDEEEQPDHSVFPSLSISSGLVRHESLLAPFANSNSSGAPKRTMSRSQSAFQPSSRTRSFARTESAASGLSSRSAASYRDHRDKQATLSLFLGSNELTKLPSALFQLHNLRVLSLRSNKLRFLPPAIGNLQNLTELQVANNQLEYLPAEILRLKLDVFTWFPNPYLVKPPKTGLLTVRPLLCHKAAHSRHHYALTELQESPEVTPVKTQTDLQHNPTDISRPPPVLRSSAVAGAQRSMDRTRSDMQVEGFLARGIDRLSHIDSIHENENEPDQEETQSSLTDTETDSNLASGIDSVDEQEAQRQRILEAAFEETESDAHFEDTTFTENDSTFFRGKVVGRSRVLGAKEVIGLPSLQELCIRKLLSPYDVAQDELLERHASPFQSPMIRSTDAARKRSSSRITSRTSSPQFRPDARARAKSLGSAGARTRSFNSNGGPEDNKFGKRVPTLLEAYENGTLQSVVGEISREIVSMLEASRRSATQDWGTRVRMSRRSSAPKKMPFVRTQSTLGAFPIEDEASATKEAASIAAQNYNGDQESDLFGSVEAAGSLDRGDDAINNPWYSRCPNPKHCEERRKEDLASHENFGPFRARPGFGSSASVSSLGTTMGRGAEQGFAVDMDRECSSSSDGGFGGRQSPTSQTSSFGTVGIESGSSSSLPSRTDAQGSHVRFTSPGARPKIGLSSTRPLEGNRSMAHPHSTNFVRGFSSLSVLSASGMRSTSFAGVVAETSQEERDWPLSEVQHRAAPIFGKAGETRIEWISHIGGVKVAKLNDAHVDLDRMTAGTNEDTEGHRSMLGAMTPFENKDLLPILWRGCSKGCLDFLI